MVTTVRYQSSRAEEFLIENEKIMRELEETQANRTNGLIHIPINIGEVMMERTWLKMLHLLPEPYQENLLLL